MRLAHAVVCLVALISAPAIAATGTAPTVDLALSLKSPAQLNRPLRNVVTIEGDISPLIADQFAASLDRDVRILAIYSTGGDVESARRIGKLVHQRNIGVEVIGFCGGVCSQYVFLAGDERILAPNSLITFGASYEALKILVSKNPDPLAASIYAADIEADRAYYQELGLPERILFDPLIGMQPQCQAIVRDTSGTPSVAHADVNSFMMLSKDYFDEIGLLVSGSWPSSEDELRQAVTGKFRQGTHFNAMIKAPSPLPSLDQEKAELSQVAACNAEQLAPVAKQ